VNEPKLIFEHPEFLVVEKPAGLLVHPARFARGDSRFMNYDSREKEPTLVDWVLARYPEVSLVGDPSTSSGQVTQDRPGIVHRLDKETSGVMLVARTQEAFLYLKSLFQKREIVKTYLAWVSGKMKESHGVINAPIGIRSGSVRRSTRSEKMAKDAITEYRVLKELRIKNKKLEMENGESRKKEEPEEIFSLLEVKPKTGRTHQIRVHLASIGHSVVGDAIYGGKRAKSRDSRFTIHDSRMESQEPEKKRMMLHALSIEFVWKDGAKMHFETEFPKGFA